MDKPVSETELDYVEAHFAELLDRYEGEWIGVIEQNVAWHGKSLSDAKAWAALLPEGVVPFWKHMQRLPKDVSGFMM